MIRLVWRRDGSGWVATGEGSKEILWHLTPVTQVDPRRRETHEGWYVDGLEDGGYFEKLHMARSFCVRRTFSALIAREAKIR